MIPAFSKVKGVHPGAVLKRELKLLGQKKCELAQELGEFPQTVGAIFNEKRGVNPKLSIKLGRKFQVADDYFMMLQASYDVKKAHAVAESQLPDLSKIRRVLFWDTDFDKIDWDKNRKPVLKRVFERGNEEEIAEMIRFYGKTSVAKALKGVENDFLPSFKENLKRHHILEE
jgi:addiction module HigA family antidote